MLIPCACMPFLTKCQANRLISYTKTSKIASFYDKADINFLLWPTENVVLYILRIIFLFFNATAVLLETFINLKRQIKSLSVASLRMNSQECKIARITVNQLVFHALWLYVQHYSYCFFTWLISTLPRYIFLTKTWDIVVVNRHIILSIS